MHNASMVQALSDFQEHRRDIMLTESPSSGQLRGGLS